MLRAAVGERAVVDFTLSKSAAGPFRACIHRGAKQIGGSCVELSFDGARILLDLGKPLDAQDADPYCCRL